MGEMNPQLGLEQPVPPPVALEPAPAAELVVNPETTEEIQSEHHDEVPVEIQVQSAPNPEQIQTMLGAEPAPVQTQLGEAEPLLQPQKNIDQFQQVVHAASQSTAEDPLERLSEFVTGSLPSGG